jgi:polysaccharide deacetylase 2 family uncharacterized protein YibQ
LTLPLALLTVRFDSMPRRKGTARFPLPSLGLVILSALVLFAIGEGYRRARTESGQLGLARTLGLGDPARVTRLLGKRLRLALEGAGVSSDHIAERVVEGHRPPVVWRVTVPAQASFLQLNFAVTHALESSGAAVLSGREAWTEEGDPMLRLVVGLPKRATHELQVVRATEVVGQAPEEPARLAVVMFGFGDDTARADSFFAVPAPFGVAVVAGTKGGRETQRAGHARGRELVLQVPLEPINYPQVNPGPGTLLVTMRPSRVASDVRRMIDQAAPVVAVANHMGSLATQDMTLMRALYREIKKDELVFLHVSPVPGAVCKALAADMGVRYAEPDVVLDYETRQADARALDRRWKEILAEAKARRRLVVWVRATPLTRRWVSGALSAKRLEGISVVPLSALLKRSAPA